MLKKILKTLYRVLNVPLVYQNISVCVKPNRPRLAIVILHSDRFISRMEVVIVREKINDSWKFASV